MEINTLRIPSQPSLYTGRVLIWFSCGVASACAAKITLEQYPDAEILYCDTLKDEHPDNLRFISDCQRWLHREIHILHSDDYTDIYDVFDKTGWLVGHGRARCTTELKRAVREAYQEPGDIHVFGLTADEEDRIVRFEEDNPEIYLWWVLLEAEMSKQDCFYLFGRSGFELPAMYKLGYKNNNCIGCVKGGKGYWNKIRQDFPDRFARMEKQERKMGARIFPDVWLDELPVNAGRYQSEFDIECGPACGMRANA